MLSKKNSGGVSSSSKQGFMSDQPLPSPTYNSPRSPLFGSPRFFVGLSPKSFSENQASMRETKFFTTFHEKNPLRDCTEPFADNKFQAWDNGEHRAVGLGIVDTLDDSKINMKKSKLNTRLLLFGSHLRIQVPSSDSSSSSSIGSVESPCSPIEFGVKTKNSQVALLSPMGRPSIRSSDFGTESVVSSPRIITGQLPDSDMELSLTEDYTCVITHGPNPRTTHIFNCYSMDCCSSGNAPSGKEDGFPNHRLGCQSNGLFNFCSTCKKNLSQEDIVFYRGMSFCSIKCQCQDTPFGEEE